MNGCRFEDTVSVKDLMNIPQKELMVKIYIQTLKTNGDVTEHREKIDKLEKEVKEKIGWKVFATLTGILVLLITTFNVLNLLTGR